MVFGAFALPTDPRFPANGLPVRERGERRTEDSVTETRVKMNKEWEEGGGTSQGLRGDETQEETL